jgi:hypothetical protein
MTSGYVRPEDQRAAEDLGIRRIITKPSTLDQMGKPWLKPFTLARFPPPRRDKKPVYDSL